MYVIHDITIKQDDEKAQIDYIIVTRGYTYIVECKNLYGDIKIDKTGQFIRNFNNHTEAIYSPYRQATRHTELIEKIKFDNSRLISKLIINNYFDSWYKPLVVLSNSESILNKNFAPKEIKNNIIRVDQLINYIKNDLKKYDRKNLNTQKGMKELANNLLGLNINEYNNFADKFKEKANDNNQVTEKVKNNEFLKEKLILFRKEKSNRKNIPAYYIFTNEELEKIINIKPKTLNELKGILSDTKINFHGKEIIDIVNKF